MNELHALLDLIGILVGIGVGACVALWVMRLIDIGNEDEGGS